MSAANALRAARRPWSPSLVRNTGWMTAGSVCRAALQLGYFLLIARALGASHYGAFAAAVALVGMAVPFAGWGSETVLVRGTARDPERFPALWGNALLLTVLTGGLLAGVISVVGAALLPTAVPVAVIAMVAVGDLVFARTVELSGRAYEGFRRLERTALLQVLFAACRLLTAVAVVGLVANPRAVHWAFGYGASAAVASIAAVILTSRELGAPTPRIALSGARFREGFYLSAGQAGAAVSDHADKLLLARLATLSAAGFYSAAYKCLDLAMIPVQAVLRAAAADFFRGGSSGVAGSLRVARSLAPIAAAYAIAAGASVWAASPLLAGLLGPAYASVPLVLAWLFLLPALKTLQFLGGDTLTGADRQPVRTTLQWLAAAASVGLNLWLIPVLGWRGAAAAAMVTDASLAAAIWICVLRMHTPGPRERANGSRLRGIPHPLRVPAPAARPRLITIGVITFRRPEGLRQLLGGLDALELGDECRPAVEILVVDNDPDGSARAVCEGCRPGAAWPVRYVHEPRPGVSFARNRVVEETKPRSDWVAFIDDDEIPETSWLAELLSAQARSDADVVAGPVTPRFQAAPPGWLLRGAFFSVSPDAGDRPVVHAGAGNVLIRTRAIRESALRFDPRMALSGGEDTLFFMQAERSGCTFTWAEKARADHTIPTVRARLPWLLRRAYRTGNARAHCERIVGGRMALRALKGAGRMLLGIARLASSPLVGRHAGARGLADLCTGAGSLSGAFGVRYEEYRRTAVP